MQRPPDDSTRFQDTNPAGVPPRRPSRLAGWSRRLGRTGLYLSLLIVLVQIVLVVTPLTEQLYLWLTVTRPPEQADVILCLGGQPERMLWAAELYHQGYAPTVVVTNWQKKADEMHKWVRMCGVPEKDLLVDRRSGTTGDHPGSVAALPGIDPGTMRFLIVTNHHHSRRVRAVFEHAGYEDFFIYGGDPPFADDADADQRWRWRVLFLPRIAYEYAALVKYRLEGRI